MSDLPTKVDRDIPETTNFINPKAISNKRIDFLVKNIWLFLAELSLRYILASQPYSINKANMITSSLLHFVIHPSLSLEKITLCYH